MSNHENDDENDDETLVDDICEKYWYYGTIKMPLNALFKGTQDEVDRLIKIVTNDDNALKWGIIVRIINSNIGNTKIYVYKFLHMMHGFDSDIEDANQYDNHQYYRRKDDYSNDFNYNSNYIEDYCYYDEHDDPWHHSDAYTSVISDKIKKEFELTSDGYITSPIVFFNRINKVTCDYQMYEIYSNRCGFVPQHFGREPFDKGDIDYLILNYMKNPNTAKRDKEREGITMDKDGVLNYEFECPEQQLMYGTIDRDEYYMIVKEKERKKIILDEIRKLPIRVKTICAKKS